MRRRGEIGDSSRDNSHHVWQEIEPLNGIVPQLDHLSPGQERRLRAWLEEQFLALDQKYNRRNERPSPLPTLQSYLSALAPLYTVILQIPPSATVMRMNFFLRLTIDLLERCVTFRLKRPRQPRRGAHSNQNGSSIPRHGDGDVDMDQGGHPKNQGQQANAEEDDDPTTSALMPLLELFALFDEGWLAILLARQWNAQAGQGVVDDTESPQRSEREREKERATRVGITETMKTMVRSTMVSGRATVDDWFERLTGEHGIVIGGDIREGFAEIFWKTLEVLEEDDEEDDWESVWDEDEGARRDSQEVMDVDFQVEDPGMFHGFDDL